MIFIDIIFLPSKINLIKISNTCIIYKIEVLRTIIQNNGISSCIITFHVTRYKHNRTIPTRQSLNLVKMRVIHNQIRGVVHVNQWHILRSDFKKLYIFKIQGSTFSVYEKKICHMPIFTISTIRQSHWVTIVVINLSILYGYKWAICTELPQAWRIWQG